MKKVVSLLTSFLVMTLAAPAAEAARLAVRGGGGTIVNDGTGDASNADLTASGDTDTLAELGFTSLTLASDLGNLEIFVTALNLDPLSFPSANAALLTTLRVFFTVDEPCETSAGPCADIESVSEDGLFSDLLFYEGTTTIVNEAQQTVLASVDIVSPPGTVLQFGTVYSYLLGNFVDESALAALLLGATKQGDPTQGFDLSQISLGFAAVFSGGELLGGTFTDLQAPVDGVVSTADPAVPEPGSLLLLGTGLGLAGARARRRLRRRD